MTFTYAEKLGCIEREISMRRRVYPRWVAAGSMTQDKAEREVQIMEAIAADYRDVIEAKTAAERLL